MTEAVKDNIAWCATINNFRADIVGRRDRTMKPLNALTNKDGLFASEHRKVIRMYGDVLDVIDRHDKK